MLNGKILPSDAGGDITDSYFIFLCTSKHDKHTELIYCGKSAASDLCNLSKNTLPSLFNPLLDEIEINNNHINNSTITNHWDAERKQLYNATMLIISAWNASPDTPLFDIKEILENPRYINLPPWLSNIKSINTILKNANTTMRSIINQLNENNTLRDFSFDLLIEHLQRENIEQFFESR